MSIKSGVAIGGAAIMWMLAFYGYEPNQAQSEGSIFGIKMLMSWIPAVIAIICIIPLLFYKLDEDKLAVIEADLKARKSDIK
jgi:GPH family glycoside/pentoside/hexuronide:cation symporter